MNGKWSVWALLLATGFVCACEAPGEKPAQEALAKVSVLRASGDKEATLTAARQLETGFPQTKAAQEARKIADEVGAEIKADREKELEKLKKKVTEIQERRQRITDKIASSRELLASLNSETDDMAHVTWYKAKGDNQVLGSWIRFYFGITTKDGPPSLMPLRLIAQLEDTSWVFARKAIFKVDGKMFDVKSDRWQHHNYGGTVWEHADVPLSVENPELMKALAECKEVKVRFEGRESIKDISVSAKQLAMLKQVFAVWQEINAAGDAR